MKLLLCCPDMMRALTLGQVQIDPDSARVFTVPSTTGNGVSDLRLWHVTCPWCGHLLEVEA